MPVESNLCQRSAILLEDVNSRFICALLVSPTLFVTVPAYDFTESWFATTVLSF